MILYQDTDSVCKRYLTDEKGIAETAEAFARADVVATSLITYAEVKGVLARARRGRRIRSNRALQEASDAFDSDWVDYFIIAVSGELITQAGRLAMVHALSGVDALHLAAATLLRERVAEAVTLSTWDRALASAATAEGLPLAHEVDL